MALFLAGPVQAANFNVDSDATLRSAITGATSGDTITFTGNITLTADLPALQTNVTIVGNNKTLSGNSQFRGLLIGAWTAGGTTQTAVTVAIQDLTITGTKAMGGSGGAGAGGGAGLGGALFVANLATVTVSNVNLDNNAAVGGAGGGAGTAAGFAGSGGGGMGGNGGTGGNGSGVAGGGGGGLGSGAAGGTASNGQAGIATGAAAGGNSAAGGVGGAAGGGGGGGGNGAGGSGGGGGGNGGFGGGGGGGGSGPFAGISGQGGFGAGTGRSNTGSGSDGGGGGGLGAGGAIFVQQGGNLTVAGTLSINGNSVTSGLGGGGGGDGSAFGAGLFLQGNGSVTFAPGIGQSQTVANSIADQTGSGGTGGDAGSYSLVKSGLGATILSATNSYSGTTTISGGTLQVGDGGTSGTLGSSVTNNALFDVVRGDVSGITGITTTGGTSHFFNNTTFGSITLTTSGGGTTTFDDFTSAGTATLVNNGASNLRFSLGSTAGSSTITNNAALSITSFNNDATAGSATITNVSGAIVFNDNSTAGSATINTDGGSTTFGGTSSAGSATITTKNGGTTTFKETASGGTATLVTNTGGTVDFSAMTTAISVGSIAGAGSYLLGANRLTLSDNSSTTVSGILSGTGGSLVKSGTGTLTLSGANSYSGGTTVSAGALLLGTGGSLASGSALAVNGGSFNLNGHAQTIGAFSGTGGTVALGTGTLTAGDSSNTTYAGGFTGTGGLIKQGSGTLTLSGISTIGTTEVAAGKLMVNGSLNTALTVDAGGSIGGSGTITGNLTVNGTIRPDIGTTNVVGTYTQAAGSTYQVEVTPGGLSDKINVTGNAVISNAAAVQVLADAGTYQRNTNYTILTASGGVTGTYASVTSNFAFLKPTLSYDANNVLLNLVASQNAFVNGAQTPNQVAVATVLDLAAPTASGDFGAVLNALYALNTQQGPAMLNLIGGQSYSGFGSVAIQGSQLFMDSFQGHAGSGSVGGGNSAGLPGSTYVALRAEPTDACDIACDGEPSWGAWGGAMGGFGTVAGSNNANGLTYNLGGFIAGIDRKFASFFRAGIAAGLNAATLTTSGVPGTGNSNTVQFALYGAYNEGALYVDGLAGYGRSDNRMNRPLAIPGLAPRTALGNTTANTFFSQLETGYKIVVAPRFDGFVTPFARLQASTSTQNGFTETGADSLDLTVAQQTTNSLRTVVGAQIGAGLDAPWREKLSMTFHLGWSHELADLSRPVTAVFAGAPALGFTTQGAIAPRDGVVLGLGASSAIADRTSIYFRYDGDLAGGNTNHIFNAGVRYVW